MRGRVNTWDPRFSSRKYLLLVRCGIDDIPIRLFDTMDDAKRAAATLRKRDVDKASAVLKLDVSVFHCLSVVVFDRGVLFAAETVRDLEKEPLAA